MELVTRVTVGTALLFREKALDDRPADPFSGGERLICRRLCWRGGAVVAPLVTGSIAMVRRALGSPIRRRNGGRSDSHCLLPPVFPHHEMLEGGEVCTDDGCVSRRESGEETVVF